MRYCSCCKKEVKMKIGSGLECPICETTLIDLKELSQVPPEAVTEPVTEKESEPPVEVEAEVEEMEAKESNEVVSVEDLLARG